MPYQKTPKLFFYIGHIEVSFHLSCLSGLLSKNAPVIIFMLLSLARVLTDCQTKLGEEYILSAFPFESDKYKALGILQTVSYSINS